MKVPKTRFQWNMVRYYTLAFFMSLQFFGAVLVPFFTDWGGISKFQMFFLQSWFAFWIFILEVPTGVIADYLGRKYSLALGAVAVTIGALLYGSVPRFEIFLLSEFLFAMAFALQSGADEALLYDTLKEEKLEHEAPKYFGKAQTVNLLGMLIAAPVGSFIASRFGLNYPMLFTAIPFFIGSILVWTLHEPKMQSKTLESKRFVNIAKEGFQFFYRHPVLRLLALDSILVAASAYYVLWFYQPLLQNIHVPILYFGYFYMLMVVSEILVSSNFKSLEKLFGSKKAYLNISAAVTGGLFILVALFPNIVTVILFLIGAGGIGYTRLQLMTAYMNTHIPSDKRATVLSSVNMFRRLVMVILNIIVGFTADISIYMTLFFIGLLPLSVFFFSPVKNSMVEE